MYEREAGGRSWRREEGWKRRTNEARGPREEGKRRYDDLERNQGLQEDDVSEREREEHAKREETEVEKREARTADVGTSESGTVGCEGRNRSPAVLPRGWAKWDEWVESRNRMESKGDAKLVCSNVVTLFFRCLRKYFPSDMYADMDSFRGRKISLINETGFRRE